MIAYRIDEDLKVSRVDTQAEGDWMTKDVIWATLSYDHENYIFYEDEGFLHPGSVLARIGVHARVPLPAYIVGMNEDSERADPTIPIEMIELSVA